ncbi:MAG: asparagine synthetase [Sulfurovum sp. FS06-10]|nr:MAG: asparagine synthetase [Sulfurovum sp. FS06-10]
MCGIAGTIGSFTCDIKEIQTKLFHRGPDAQTHYRYNNVNLIHTRLSIQDREHGAQPFLYDQYAIIFNGEIYNHLALRTTYLQGFNFSTYSDTETLLYMYIKYRHKMFAMLDGMFAFAILDKEKNKLIVSRDRAGKKPLYYYSDGHRLMFASELNVIKSTVKNLVIDEASIQTYLRCGFFYKDMTPYHNVSMFDAGTMYEVDLATLGMKKEQYFSMTECYHNNFMGTFESALEGLDEALHKSIKDRMMASDIEVGAFLSGGIDSSLVVAIASEYTKKLKTFTVKFEGAYDESALARITAKQYETEHYEINIAMNLKDDIETIVQSYGEPFMDSSAIPSYYVAKEAKKYVSVVLNGDGADELFGGYRRYVPIANHWIEKASYFSFLYPLLPQAHNKKTVYNYLYRLLSIASKRGLDFYLGATTDIFEDAYRFNQTSIMRAMSKDIENISTQALSELSKMLIMDFDILLHSDLLKKMDIATMQHSLEARSPFLSKYLLEFAPTLKDSYKIKGRTTKYILRELARKYLSVQLISQPKRGFEVPLKQWVEKDMKEPIFDALMHHSYSEHFIDKTFIHALLNKKIDVSDEKRAKMLWTMYALELWKKQQ